MQATIKASTIFSSILIPYAANFHGIDVPSVVVRELISATLVHGMFMAE